MSKRGKEITKKPNDSIDMDSLIKQSHEIKILLAVSSKKIQWNRISQNQSSFGSLRACKNCQARNYESKKFSSRL